MNKKEELEYIENNKLRFLSFKLDTGMSMLNAKSEKGSEGCILNCLPLIALKCLKRHVEKIIEFRESNK